MNARLSDHISDQELDVIQERVRLAAPGPWCSFVEGRDHESGSSFIQTPDSDIELFGASVADQDFIAHARDDIPRLLAEIRRFRNFPG